MSYRNYFPYPEFRQQQEEVIQETIEAFDGGTDVVIIDAPTGFGKSPVNLCVGLTVGSTYYTTPQKNLRNQLEQEFSSKRDVAVLKARKDYVCGATKVPSDQCIVYREKMDPLTYKECSCTRHPNCTYWNHKKKAFDAPMSILTFAGLIVNSYLPPFYITPTGETIQLSFLDRELLIVDECHGLEEQVASLHAGFTIHRNRFVFNRDDVLRDIIWKRLMKRIPVNKTSSVKEYIPFLEQIIIEMNLIIRKFRDQKIIEKATNLKNKTFYLLEELKEGREWVVNRSTKRDWNTLNLSFKPIKVDRFLQKHIWRYGKKYLLTSATVPYPNDTREWLDRIGLSDKKFKRITVPMFFPIENRPIYLNKIAGSMNRNDLDKTWPIAIKNIKEILKLHSKDRGVIHASSYAQCKRLQEDIGGIYVHDTTDELDTVEGWINSGKRVLASPAIFEGADLKDELCRFQILLKVPYAFIGDARVNYLLYKKKDQNWYNNETMIKIVQAYGRAVRSKEDFASFYVIDAAFLPFYYKASFPNWFKEAIIFDEV